MKTKILLVFILLFALFFRLYGLNWDQGQHLHPDERFLTMVLTEIQIPKSFGDYLNPTVSSMSPYNHNFDFFVYGTFPLNLTKIIGSSIGFNDYDHIHFVGRVLSALFDVGVVFLIFQISKKIFNPRVGLIASFLYSIMVLPIQLSHFFTVDPFLNFFVVLTFYFLVLFLKSKQILKYSFSMGISFGFALACKISAVYFLPIIFIAYIYKFINFLKKQKKFKDILSLIIGGFIFLLSVALFFRLNQPQVFSSGNLLNWQINPQFISNLKTLQYYNDPKSLYPPGIQWLKTTPIIFPFKNLILWGLGLPLGVLFLISLFFSFYNILKTKLKSVQKIIFSLLLFWVIGLFVYQGIQTVKTMRYFLFIYPFIAIITAYFLSSLKLKNKTLLKFVFLIICFLILIYPLSFITIYDHDITRLTASKWIYQNIPASSTLATEYWDDALPLPINGYGYGVYQNESLSLYDQETPEKWQKIKSQLSHSDYIVLSSNRLYGSIPENPDIYPQTTKYYQSLFDGSLGFQKVAEFVSRPCFKPFGYQLFCFNDDNAEEAFTVYDHPKVLIFKKVAETKNL